MGRTPRERVPYSAIVDRPPLTLPDGARMAVWSIVNVEDWSIERPMPRTVLPPPMGQPLLPDLPNWAWHEYGMRVGFWRLKRMYERLGISPTVTLNAKVCETYPPVVEACLGNRWELNAHSYEQIPMQRLDDERSVIKRTIDTIEKFSGTRPRGWFGPGLTQTFETIDYLAEAGIQYIGDWVLDDQPCVLKTKHAPVVALPYNFEIHDIAMMAIQHHPAGEWLSRGKDYFDRLYDDSGTSARVMAIAMHPYITGVPHRIRYLEELYQYVLGKPGVAHMTGGEIMDWFTSRAPASYTTFPRKPPPD